MSSSLAPVTPCLVVILLRPRPALGASTDTRSRRCRGLNGWPLGLAGFRRCVRRSGERSADVGSRHFWRTGVLCVLPGRNHYNVTLFSDNNNMSGCQFGLSLARCRSWARRAPGCRRNRRRCWLLQSYVSSNGRSNYDCTHRRVPDSFRRPLWSIVAPRGNGARRCVGRRGWCLWR